MKLNYIICFLIILILSACGNSGQDFVASQDVVEIATSATLTITPEPTATKTITPTPTDTLTPTSTFTPLPTSTSTASETPSPTPIPLAVVDVQLANIYSGVATYAPIVAVFTKETALKILGIAPDDSWLLVEIAPEQNGWVQKKVVRLENQVSLPTIEPPPPPTLTPTPEKLPSVRVQAGKDVFIMEFFNFQPKEKLNITIYKYEAFLARAEISTGSSGYAIRHMSWLKLSLGVNYRLVVNGVKGSYVEKSFTP